MKTLSWIALLMVFCPLSAFAQTGETEPGGVTPDSSQIAEPVPAAPLPEAPPSPKGPSKVYFGGSVMLSFGDLTRIGIRPMIGYKLNPRFSLGGKVGYDYMRDTSYDPTFDSHNYGFSVFGRYNLLRQLYAHAEYASISYDYRVSSAETRREWIPFLLVGGGYHQAISPRASAYLEVLVDVLQDSKSPFSDWEPQISAGIAVGF